ncbi:MAG: hypothetical protein IAE77_14085 [Prosthecobacter sp.]|uniref:hypothetical protein n=1 Tax=Prosthecobacter sp. TaxID=1965333 RepID=UPI0019F23283|nr:hypothetical protein [Prosthecobacter sp.]MBE2284582.1 hypothetical protein [Prosthecobacter sp.]
MKKRFLLPGVSRIYAPIYLAEACNFAPIWKHVRIEHKEVPDGKRSDDDPVLEPLLARGKYNDVIAIAADPLRIWSYWDTNTKEFKKADCHQPCLCGSLVTKSPFRYRITESSLQFSENVTQAVEHIVTSGETTTAFSVALCDLEDGVFPKATYIDRGRIGMVEELAKCVASRNSETKVGYISSSANSDSGTHPGKLADKAFLVTTIITTMDNWAGERVVIDELLASISLALSYMQSSPEWAASELARMAKRIPDSKFQAHFADKQDVEDWIRGYCLNSISIFNPHESLEINKAHFEEAVQIRTKAWKKAAALDSQGEGQKPLAEKAKLLDQQKEQLWEKAVPNEVIANGNGQPHSSTNSRAWLSADIRISESATQKTSNPLVLAACTVVSVLVLPCLSLLINLPADWPKIGVFQDIATLRNTAWATQLAPSVLSLSLAPFVWWLIASISRRLVPRWRLVGAVVIPIACIITGIVLVIKWRIAPVPSEVIARLMGAVAVFFCGLWSGRVLYDQWRHLDSLPGHERQWWKSKATLCVVVGGFNLFSLVLIAANLSDAWASVMASMSVLVAVMATRSHTELYSKNDALRANINRVIKKLCTLDYLELVLERKERSPEMTALGFSPRGLGIIDQLRLRWHWNRHQKDAGRDKHSKKMHALIGHLISETHDELFELNKKLNANHWEQE